ncbi:MAG: PolC-type DNA polymerase III [Clostridia bacterium]|nr:PolC-type DNA polymerase III [Clostridia bacterium]
MNEKGFLDIFARYSPADDKRELLSRARSVNARIRREPTAEGEGKGRIVGVEVDLYFDSHQDPELIYEIEDECIELYSMETFKILPHFPPEAFKIGYFDEIALEAALCGAITNGFFNGAEYSDDGETITVGIPYFSSGVDFVKSSGTEETLSNILRSRYGIVRKINITEGLGAEERRDQIMKRREESMARAEAEGRERFISEQAAMRERERAADPYIDFEAKAGISSETGTAEALGETVYRMGASTFDFSEPEHVFGEDFEIIEPTPLAEAALKVSRGKLLVLGTVFDVAMKETRAGDKMNCTIGISDGASAIYMKKTLKNDPNELEWVKELEGAVKKGKRKLLNIAAQGRVQTDKFDNEPYLSVTGIKRIKTKHRMDTAEEKRVELHLHTNMSQMDAIITPAELIDTAIRWGHKAIAVTDHGNVQSFPEVMLALEGSKNEDLKVLYGTEAYYVNDTARCIFGKDYPAFEDEMVVFDIETTGLSNRTARIIEIGAVKIKSGEIIDKFDIFVDPETHIPEEITELTSITDEMVSGAPKEREAIEKFLAFAGDKMLIAHNANFDVGFIRIASERQGFPFENTYLDTLGLSKYVNPELKNHKLNTIVDYYKLGDFHHHRASDDAEVLAHIFTEMLSRLKKEGLSDFEGVMAAMGEAVDPIKLPPYHLIVFAKNQVGLKNLYKLISYSYLNYYGGFGRNKKVPRMPKSVIEEHREGLVIGSACVSGELYSAILDGKKDSELEELCEFYDYLEIQPICNNMFLLNEEEKRGVQVGSVEELKEINRKIYNLGKKLGKPVCATCDAHFVNKEDEIYRRILLAGMKFKDADKDEPIYLRTTDEMLAEFEYLGKEAAYEVVVTNPNKIADMFEKIRPIPTGRYEPDLPGAKEELESSCWQRAHEWYGDDLPEIVEKRLEKELTSIIKNGFAVLYMIAVKLVAYSESLGYQVGSRGSVGSSFVATMSGISEVNPLPPHYRCKKCRYSEFFTDGSVGSGFDLPDKRCPVCGEWLYQDGHDIPFETFLGFYGDKSPDIDLNFSGDVQGKVHKYTEELFGAGHVYRAGTTTGLADKTAWGYISKYLEERKIKIPKAQIGYMVTRIMGIKKTTGQHPGGIIVVPNEYDIYDFTPIQHPADDPNADTVTTHFQFSYLHDTILKLDELGHDMPTKYKILEKYTNTSVLDVKMNDKTIYELFASTKPLGITPDQIGGAQLATFGIPEFGTRFLQQVLVEAKPKNFADLLQISGLTHGTDVWLGNAQELIKNGTCDISEVVGTRDGIMLYLIQKGLDNSISFKIMEDVRKGKGLKPEYEAEMLAHGVPDWYIWSCKKIKYMFPKAHAAAYVMSAIRLAWYKIYYPMEFYAAFLTVAPGGFDAEIIGGGYDGVNAAIKELEAKGTEATAKDNETCQTLYLVREAMARGVKFLNVDLKKSDATAFLPENGKIRMPFNSLPGLGDKAADKILEARAAYDIQSIEDLKLHTGISKAVIELLRRNHVLDGLSETNQFSFF